MGHDIAGCLLVKLFALQSTYFRIIFSVGSKENVAAPGEQRLQNETHISDWTLFVSSLLTWQQWMKQPTIAKKQIKGPTRPSNRKYSSSASILVTLQIMATDSRFVVPPTVALVSTIKST
jgi:hypothetical protein